MSTLSDFPFVFFSIFSLIFLSSFAFQHNLIFLVFITSPFIANIALKQWQILYEGKKPSILKFKTATEKENTNEEKQNRNKYNRKTQSLFFFFLKCNLNSMF